MVKYYVDEEWKKENPKSPIRVFLSYLFFSSFCKMHFDPINFLIGSQTSVIGYRTVHNQKSGLPNTLICIAVISREMILYFLFFIFVIQEEQWIVLRFTLVRSALVVWGETTDTIPVMKHFLSGGLKPYSGYASKWCHNRAVVFVFFIFGYYSKIRNQFQRWDCFQMMPKWWYNRLLLFFGYYAKLQIYEISMEGEITGCL